jgi:ADP-ribose pyrophosphatase YjhB (NUDIX family)
MNMKGDFYLLHRSINVRSARNCWSLPSGLHEVGLSVQAQFAQEIREELNLEPIVEKFAHIGFYENIRPDGDDRPGWHWCIHVMAMRVISLDSFVNKEPDKHDEVARVNIRQDWIDGRTWSRGLDKFLVHNRKHISTVCQSLL